MPLEASPISRRRGDSGVANEGSVISRLRRSDRAGARLSRLSVRHGSATHPASDPGPTALLCRLVLPLGATLASPAFGPLGAPLTIGNGASWTTTNFTGGAGFGYRWNDWLRFDATWDYRTGPGGSRQATVVCPYGLTGITSPAGVPLGFLYDTTNTCNASANVRQYDNAFLANAYFDVGTYY